MNDQIFATVQPQTPRKGLDPFHYQKLASRFLEESGHCFRFYAGRVLRYAGDRYLEETDLCYRLRRFMIRSGIPHNNNVIGNVEPFIKATTYLDPSVYKQLPFFFGTADADPKDIIAFRNGLLDVKKAMAGDHGLIPHSPGWISLNCLPYDYVPGAECPRWVDFLMQTFEGDEERLALLQEYAGYLLLPDASRQKMLAMVGVSRGGKGTVSTMLQRLLGDGNWTAYELTALADKFGKGSLVGRLAAFVGEVNLQKHRDKYQILSNLNSITGCDPVEVEWKHNPLKTSYLLPVRFVIACNAFPIFADPSGALAERVLVLNFRRAVPEDQRDPHLATKLYGEIPGICNWALKGLARLNRNDRFTVPELAKETINKIRRNASPVVAFAQDRLKVNPLLDTGNLPNIPVVEEELWTWKSDLLEAYLEWSKNHDGEVNTAYLRRDLETVLPSLKESRPRDALNGSRRIGFAGIGLRGE